MIKDYDELTILPPEFQQHWRAQLNKATPTESGVFRLVHIEKSTTRGHDSQRITVLVVDENRLPLQGIKVAFAYDTANRFLIDEQFKWMPPLQRADIFTTQGGGQIDHVQGSPVKDGEPGGVTAFMVEPEYSSDYVTGAGMLSDHTGMRLVFQLRREGYVSIWDRLAGIERRLAGLEAVG